MSLSARKRACMLLETSMANSFVTGNEEEASDFSPHLTIFPNLKKSSQEITNFW
jgi:hypothetical protein